MPDPFGSLLPAPWNAVASAALAAGLLVSFVAGSALIFIWLERKISARMQDRLGPTRVGPFGLLQTLADGIKLLVKEDFLPDAADKFLFRLAPYLAFVASFVAFAALPFSMGIAGHPTRVAAFFMLAALASEVFGVILAGYASANKWSIFGGIREAAQVVSYEIPRGLAVLVPVVAVGSLDLNQFSRDQQGYVWDWVVFRDPFCFLAFILFFVCATASCKRAPFDLAEAESELVGGFHTEYSGLRWSVFFMAEYASMFAVSGLAALLFLGGWHTGLLPWEMSEEFGVWGHLLNAAVFIGKGFMLVMVMMWVRWSLPRLRIDQVMTVCLKYFLPIGCVLLVGEAAYRLWVPPVIARPVNWLIAGSVIFGLMLALLRLFTAPLGRAGRAPPRRLAGRGGEIVTTEAVLFAIVAGSAAACALAVLLTARLVRAALGLLLTLLAVGVGYFLLGAEFVGAAQLIVYAGGIVVLLVFGVMLTADPEGREPRGLRGRWPGLFASAALGYLLILATTSAVLPSAKDSAATPGPAELGAALLEHRERPADDETPARLGYLFPFEILSMHLVVALIAAAYLARPRSARAGDADE